VAGFYETETGGVDDFLPAAPKGHPKTNGNKISMPTKDRRKRAREER